MKYLWIILLSTLALSATAQRMRVDDFVPYRKASLKKNTLTVDKRQALLDLFTNEQGFQFQAGDVAIAARENEGFLTLALPPHTDFLTIKHPDYGQLVWKIPGKPLKKKKRYRAYLYTESPGKEFRQEKQWALFSVQPEHAILYVDSSMHTIRDGHLALYLPIGRHVCRIESPFYKTLCDTIELTDSARFEKQFFLESFYAYLTVETDLPHALILLDGQPLGLRRIETGRLMPGRYRISIRQDNQLYYDRFLEIANAERKVLDLRNVSLRPIPSDTLYAEQTSVPSGSSTLDNSSRSNNSDSGSSASGPFSAPRSKVHLTAFDAQTEIWLNREPVGTGEWQGELPPGFYAVSSRKDGLESRTDFFWVEPGKTVELNLHSPLADYGLLNISCNEEGAHVFLNDMEVGVTPCVIRNLPTDRSYRIRLIKDNQSAECTLLLKKNDIVNVNLQLRKP